MSRVPTRQLTALYERIMKNPNTGIRSKNYDAMYLDNANEVILWHYNTMILRINLNDGTWMPGGGFSVSDRDAINSFLYLADVDGYAYIRDYSLHYWVGGFIRDHADEFTEFKSNVRVLGMTVTEVE